MAAVNVIVEWLRSEKSMKMTIAERVQHLEFVGFKILRGVRHCGAAVGDLYVLKKEIRVAISAPRGKYRTADCIIL